jgi:hypothetical protein
MKLIVDEKCYLVIKWNLKKKTLGELRGTNTFMEGKRQR